MTRNFVSIKGRILSPMNYGLDTLKDHNLSPLRCAHDTIGNIRVMLSMHQWECVASKSNRFIVVGATVEGNRINACNRSAGVVPAPKYAYSDVSPTFSFHEDAEEFDVNHEVTLQVGELFCGGFSGWSHAGDCLNDCGLGTKHVWALDKDPIAAKVFSLTHGSTSPLVGIDDVIRDLQDDRTKLFQVDIGEHWWLTAASLFQVDAILLSPPCQPWSEAHSAQGFLREDGKASIHGWGHVGLLRPRLAIMEMVHGMMHHRHFSFLQAFIDWMGYDIRGIESINASKVCPQNRERMFLIAVNRFAKNIRHHRFQTWQKSTNPNLRTFGVPIKIGDNWGESIPGDDVLYKYLCTDMLPHRNDPWYTHKRTKRDAIAYRIRTEEDQFACIMASYGFAHEMPNHVILRGGIYGSLILHDCILRFLSLPELVILQGAVRKQWLPNDQRVCSRILGNAIILPHAILALLNVHAWLNFRMDIARILDTFETAMNCRMHSGNIRWTHSNDGFLFEQACEDEFISSTVPMHQFGSVTVQNPVEEWSCHIEFGISIRKALSVLMGPSCPMDIQMKIANYSKVRIPLSDTLRMNMSNQKLMVSLPQALMVDIHRFKQDASENGFALALTIHGPFVVKHEPSMTVQDILNIIISHDLFQGIQGLQGLTILGETIEGCQKAPMCLIVVPFRDLPIFDTMWISDIGVTLSAQAFQLQGNRLALHSFVKFLRAIRGFDILKALGWYLTAPIDDSLEASDHTLLITRCPGTIGILQDDLHVLLGSLIFCFLVQKVEIPKDPQGIHCRLKLWNQVIWEESLAPFAQLKPITDTWNAVTSFLGKASDIRLVSLGKVINPDFPINQYLPEGSFRQTNVMLHVVLELKGGGSTEDEPIVINDPQENILDIPRHQSFDDIIPLINNDFDGCMAQVLTEWLHHFRPHVPSMSEPYRRHKLRSIEGLFLCDGTLHQLMAMIRSLEHDGISDVLKMLGWIVSLHFRTSAVPVDVCIMIHPHPTRNAAPLEFVRSFIQAAVTTVCLPESSMSATAIHLRIKLWGCLLFDCMIPQHISTQEIVAAWNIASRFSTFPTDIRLVSRGKRVHSDVIMNHLARVDDLGIPYIRLHLIIPLRGGGPPTKEQNGLLRDTIALLYLSNGYDFKSAADVSHAFCKMANPQALQKAMRSYPDDKRFKALEELAGTLAIKLPEKPNKQTSNDIQVRSKLKSSGKTSPASLDLSCLTIKPGYFLNNDASEVIQRQGITPATAGIALLSWEEAKEWITNSESISQDELGVLIIGECHGNGVAKCQRLQVPMYDQDQNPMIVSGCLHNLGCKEIRVSKLHNADVVVGASSIVGFTIFKDEVDNGTWSAVLKHPVRTTFEMLLGPNHAVKFPTPPWGRTWYDGKKKCKPEESVSLQFHIRVADSDVANCLRASGASGVYSVVKTSDKKVSQDYQIIWVEGSHVEIALMLHKYSQHQGIVRSTRTDGKINKGIRVFTRDFDQAFIALKPNCDKPEVVPANHMFRISPVPCGATSEHLRQWFKEHKLKAKPVRSLGDRVWLCAASEKFADEFLTWGNDIALVKWLNKKSTSQQSTVLASIKSFPTRQIPPPQEGTDSIWNDDPWSQWKGTSSASASLIQRPKSVNPSFAATRTVEAPIEDRFRSIETKMQNQQDISDDRIQKLHDQMQTIQDRMGKQEETHSKHEAAVQQEFTTLREETAKSFQSMTESFQQSLQQSLATQNQSLSTQFAELRSLLQNRGNPAKKAKATKPLEGDEKMEEEDQNL